VIVLGVRCAKENLDWAVVEGDQRGTSSVAEQRKVSIPDGQRGDQLAWVRKEVMELLERHALEAAAVRVAEPGGQSVSLGRAEVEGVVQEALASAGLAPVRHVAATIRSIYGARSKPELASALSAIPVIEGIGTTRREPVVSAVALLPG
jgi:Holliday junction resolvasome RuvABC endonuclease subunit